jgi:UPF0042 nucleotide-binding protein
MTGAPKQIVIVSGTSGSGKSAAIRALEDVGFFCIDNLPVVLLPRLTELIGLGGGASRLAVVVDARETQYLNQAPAVIDEARLAGHRVRVLFLDANDEVLIRRFSETRRRHPLAPSGTVLEGIALERDALQALRKLSDQVIDSSSLNVHDLKRVVQASFMSEPQMTTPSVTVMSFGFRYGVPPQADLVFDVRFLPNPFFVPELKALTGREPKVAAYVLERAETEAFLNKVVDLCEFLLPLYQREGKAYLTVAIGCTGGKHRSVALAEALKVRLSKQASQIQRSDRDIEKE